jgi:hypothetical protein
MLYRLLAIAIILLAAPIGCKENTQPVEPSEVEVTEENLDAALDKMEQEINADAEAE